MTLKLSEETDTNERPICEEIENEEQGKVDESVQKEGAASLSNQGEVEVNRGNEMQKEERVNTDWPKERVCHTHERAIPVHQTVETLDITEEGKPE